MMNKRPWQICTKLPLAAVVLLFAAPLGHSEPPPARIDVSKFRYQESEVVIPVPGEVFRALDKMGNPNWGSALMSTSTAKPNVPPEIAMLLGTVIANGFVAVEAKNGEAVDEIGRKVIKLSEALGVRGAVVQHSNAIIEAAKNDKWDAVRSELDKAQSSVRDAMNSLNSQDESELVSIAGWLRGTQALTSLIVLDYKPERAELLNQPDMFITFEHQFNGMSKRVQANKLVTELREGLKKVKALIPTTGSEPVSEKTVQQINAITTQLVKDIAP